MERIPHRRVERDRSIPPAADPCGLSGHDGDRPDRPAARARALPVQPGRQSEYRAQLRRPDAADADASLPEHRPAGGILLRGAAHVRQAEAGRRVRRAHGGGLRPRAAARPGDRTGADHDPARRPDPRLSQPTCALRLPCAQAHGRPGIAQRSGARRHVHPSGWADVLRRRLRAQPGGARAGQGVRIPERRRRPDHRGHRPQRQAGPRRGRWPAGAHAGKGRARGDRRRWRGWQRAFVQRSQLAGRYRDRSLPGARARSEGADADRAVGGAPIRDGRIQADCRRDRGRAARPPGADRFGALARAAGRAAGAGRLAAQPARRHRGRSVDSHRLLRGPEFRRRDGQTRAPGPCARGMAAVCAAPGRHLAPFAARAPGPPPGEARRASPLEAGAAT